MPTLRYSELTPEELERLAPYAARGRYRDGDCLPERCDCPICLELNAALGREFVRTSRRAPLPPPPPLLPVELEAPEEEELTCTECGERADSVDSQGRGECCQRGVCGNCDTEIDRDESYCQDCRDCQCRECGSFVAYPEDLDDFGKCSDCGGPIRSHSYKPDPEFNYAKGERRGRDHLFLGVELEVELPEDCDRDDEARKAPEAAWYAKEDGSLTNGVEFVSHPGTWKWWNETDLGWVEDNGWKAYKTETCGMHVHISRRGLSKFTLYKILTFFAQNPEYVLRISRRERDFLDKWAAIEQGKEIIYRKARYGESRCRYQAVNVEGRNTVEFRIFRGTVNPERIKQNIAWVYGVVSWLRNAPLSKLRPHDFHAWLRSADGVKFLGKMAAPVLNWSLKCV